NHAFLLHALDQGGSAVIADRQTALDIGGGGLLVLQHDIDGLVVKLVSGPAELAALGESAGAFAIVFLGDRFQIVGAALHLEVAHDVLDLCVRAERAVQAANAAAAGHIEHVAHAQKLLGALFTQNGAAV